MSEFDPITLIRFRGDSFGAYIEEILVAEGFPYVKSARMPLDLVAERNPLIILPHGDLPTGVIRQLISQIEEGAALFAMRPPGILREELGLQLTGEIPGGYISWSDQMPIQIHSGADIFSIDTSWEELAILHDVRGKFSGPGLISSEIGNGRVTVFPFNLPESVVLTRQGNPAWIGSKGDEYHGGVRPGDLFCRLNGESWIDFRNTDLPQADLIQRFFVDQILSISGLPLPRTWYFPRMQRTSVTIVADSDSATPREVGIETDLVQSHGGVYSLYLIDKTLDGMTAKDMSDFLAGGHEASIHPNYNRVGDPLSPEVKEMKALYGEMVARFEEKFGLRPVTMRHHSGVWCGWVDVPRIQAEFGLKLDDCYGYPPWFGQERYGGSGVGYITGSGQPQRFCELNGEIIQVYQLEQNLEDEILLPDKGLGISGAETAKRLVDFVEASIDGLYSHVVACFHPITVATNPEAYGALDDFLSHCEKHSLPLRTLREVSEFADLRRGISFGGFYREGDDLSFEISGTPGACERGVSVILPARGISLIEVDAEPAHWRKTLLWGREHLYKTPDRMPVSVRITQLED